MKIRNQKQRVRCVDKSDGNSHTENTHIESVDKDDISVDITDLDTFLALNKDNFEDRRVNYNRVLFFLITKTITFH